ncbi:hypothetical protein TEA_006812 [Camellia sinensis var. sinensis]|uniref:TLC domain-containing protein n=1 Tax=Camellia sinensis var. sinensis TaxID=542762 RepID=A0A4S4EEG6_CAMSN|nr:hypothetical protein TEA_006812 [Camellia sinensis var. sinensis]
MGLSQFIQSIDWQQESYPEYEDFAVLPLFALFFPSVRFFLDRFIFEVFDAALMIAQLRLAFPHSIATVVYQDFHTNIDRHNHTRLSYPPIPPPLNPFCFHSRALAMKLGRQLIFAKGQQTLAVETDDRKKKIRKFKESAWKCIYYLSAEILAVSVTYNEPWFTNTRCFWVGPGNQVWPDQKIKLKLKGVYMYTAGFYTYSIFALIFWETRRADFGVSMGHHVATLILILLSYILRFARVGSVVLALHDASDVFLEVGKMSKYSGAETLASFAFILLVLSWILLRLIYYPFWVLWSTRCCPGPILYRGQESRVSSIPKFSPCIVAGRLKMEFLYGFVAALAVGSAISFTLVLLTSHFVVSFSFLTFYEVVQTLDKEKHKVEGPIYYYVFNSLLFCLLVLHIYWWGLMYRMLVKQIQARGQISEDVRSDSEGEDEHED